MKERSMNFNQKYSALIGRTIGLAGLFLFQISADAQGNKTVLKQAESYFAAGEYYTAANLYQQYLYPVADKSTGSNFPLNAKRKAAAPQGNARLDVLYRQAESYRLANYWPEAAAAYQACVAEDPVKYADSYFWLAVANRNLNKIDSARYWLMKYPASPSMQFIREASAEKQKLGFIQSENDRPDSILFSTQLIQTEKLPGTGMFATQRLANGELILSTTVPTDQTASNSNPNKSRIFRATVSNGKLENIRAVDIALDSNFNWGAASISPDGKHLLITRWSKIDGVIRSAIFSSTKNSSGWSQPEQQMLGAETNINNKQPFYTADGQWLLFSSDREGGSGGYDIWYARVGADGTISNVKNAGNILNTPANEVAPYYHSSSNCLVFATDGRIGMGGYDLFISSGFFGGNWSAVQNAGKPVNSVRDDIYFSATENEPLLRNALVGSDRGAGCCIETFSISKAAKKQILQGTVKDCRTGQGLANARITLNDNEGKNYQTRTNENGIYSVETLSIPMQDFRMTVEMDGYKDSSMALSIDSRKNDWLTDYSFATAICEEKKLMLKVENVVTVYFGYDKSELTAPTIAKLDSIITMLNAEPTARVQISGYTDGKGSVEYNQKLSVRRATACGNYLIEHGIDEKRISYESFGSCCPVEMELIDGRDNPDARSKNRRALINIDRE